MAPRATGAVRPGGARHACISRQTPARPGSIAAPAQNACSVSIPGAPGFRRVSPRAGRWAREDDDAALSVDATARHRFTLKPPSHIYFPPYGKGGLMLFRRSGPPHRRAASTAAQNAEAFRGARSPGACGAAGREAVAERFHLLRTASEVRYAPFRKSRGLVSPRNNVAITAEKPWKEPRGAAQKAAWPLWAENQEEAGSAACLGYRV